MSAPRRLLAAATTLAALGLPATAHAGWSAPLPVSPAGAAGDVFELDIAFDAEGDAVAAWAQDSGPDVEDDTQMWLATRPAGGAWSTPKLVAADNTLYTADDAFHPRVVVHPSGRTVVQWEENTAAIPYRTNVVVAVGEAGDASSFGDPVTVHAPSQNGGAAEPVFGPDGVAHLVYNVGPQDNNRTYERTLAPGASAWSAPVAVAPAMTVPQYDLDLAIDAEGNSALVWGSDYAFDEGVPDVNAVVRPAGGSWSAPHQLDANVESLRKPQVAIDAGGRALAVWGTSISTPVRMAAFSFPSPDPTWSAASSMIEEEEPVALESGDDGLVHLLTRNGAQLFHRTLATGSIELSEPESIESTISSYEYEPVLAVGPGGEAAVSYMGGDQRTYVALLHAGEWGAPVAVTPEGLRARQTPAPVAWDNLGSVVAGVVRERANDGAPGADLVVLDRTPPELTEASLQTSGHAGQPFAFSALGVDDWSTVSYEWSFGDGATASGSSVEHTYATAGTRSLVLRLVSAGGVLELPPLDVAVSGPLTHEEEHEEEEKPPVVVSPPVTHDAPAPPVVHPPALPTIAQVVKVLGTFPKPPVATAKEATFEQSFPGKGLAKWDLFLGRPAATGGKASAAAKAKAVLLGSSKKAIAGAGKVKAKIKLSAKRRKALKKARRPQVFLRTTFTDEAGRTVATVTKVRVKR